MKTLLSNLIHNRFLTILIVVHLIFFVIKVFIGDYFLADSFEYYQLSKNILDNFQFYSSDLTQAIVTDHYTKRPPLYPIFIILSSVGFTSNIFVLFCQNLLSILSFYLLKKIFDHHFKINESYLIILIAISINQFIYANLLLSEILFQFLIILLLYSLFKFIQESKAKYFIWYQVLIVALFLTKPVFYLFIIPNLFITFFVLKNKKNKPLLVTALVPIISLAFFIFWNYNRTGYHDVSSIQNINLLDYNLKYFHTYKYGEAYADKINTEIKSLASQKTSYKEQQQFIKSESIDYLKEDLYSYGIFHTKGVFRFFIDPGRFDLYNFFGYEKRKSNVGLLKELNTKGLKGSLTYLKKQPLFILSLFVILLIFNFVKAISFCFFWIKNYKNVKFIFYLMLFIILYLAFLTGPLGASRFMVPILPIYIFFCALGLEGILKSIKNLFTKRKQMLFAE